MLRLVVITRSTASKIHNTNLVVRGRVLKKRPGQPYVSNDRFGLWLNRPIFQYCDGSHNQIRDAQRLLSSKKSFTDTLSKCFPHTKSVFSRIDFPTGQWENKILLVVSPTSNLRFQDGETPQNVPTQLLTGLHSCQESSLISKSLRLSLILIFFVNLMVKGGRALSF